MKKFLLLSIFAVSLGYFNPSQAQCNGVDVVITNFQVNPSQTFVSYSFDYQKINGNASIQVQYLCNGVLIESDDCIQNIGGLPKDVTFSSSGTRTITCTGVFEVRVVIFASPNCGGTNCIAFSRIISQATLPVSFKSFTATRNKANVMVKWETATEINNSGFAVERNVNGTWEQVAFVPTQAPNGNSENVLNYTYTDLNNSKGISQYRIKQVDFDNNSKYTEIRSVKGDGQIGKIIVYPNPTADGRVNVVFDDATVTRSIIVTDMSGRTVKQINSIANNNITIDNLQPGFYSFRVFVQETGEQSVMKVVVNKR